MRKTAIMSVATGIILFFLPVVATAVSGNTVYFEKVKAKPGESFAVTVYLANADTLSGAQVPIFYRSEKIKLNCDSVSFAGSRMAGFSFHEVKVPLVCEKCGREYDLYDEPPKKPGICDEKGCGGKVVQRDRVVFFMAIDNTDPRTSIPPMYPGDGQIAKIYFTVPKDSPTGVVKLTRGMIPHPTLSLVLSVWNPRGDDLDVDFVDGEIVIEK